MIYPIITSFYAALFALLYLKMTFDVFGIRRELKINLGDNGEEAATRVIRAHANFNEFVPLGLVLMLTAELMGTPAFVLHLFAVSFLVGRLAHRNGLKSAQSKGRFTGMILTIFPIGALAIGLLGHTALYMLETGYDQPRDRSALIELE